MKLVELLQKYAAESFGEEKRTRPLINEEEEEQEQSKRVRQRIRQVGRPVRPLYRDEKSDD